MEVTLEGIAAMIGALCAVGALIFTGLSYRKIGRVEKHSNGMVKQLRAISKAAGLKQGRAEARRK